MTATLAGLDFYDRYGYFDALKQLAEQSGKGDDLIYMAMVINPASPEVAAMMDAMEAAARRGAKVTAVVDAHSFMLDDDNHLGPLWHTTALEPDQLKGPFKVLYDKLQNLRMAGGSYRIVNRPAKAHTNPFGGRSHIKLAVVNDRVFIGGCNIQLPEIRDVMIGWDDAATATWLRNFVHRIGDALNVRQALGDHDQEHAVAPNATLFVDAGVKRQSTIMQQAHRLIDQAEETVTITCQYFPGGATADRLLAARKRGVRVTIHYSPPSAHGTLATIHYLYNGLQRLRLPADMFTGRLPADAPKLHSKIIVSEKAALIGSHNYVQAGVRFGTAEIALLVKDDRDFIDRTLAHINMLLGR